LSLRFARLTWWFLFQRPLDAAEVAVAAWLAWTALYIFWAASSFELGRSLMKAALSLTILLPFVVAGSLLRLAMRKRWAAIVSIVLVVVAVAPLAGMVQFERCPHATYLQIIGVSIPVEGNPCNNPRRVEPWWLRD
jgi:hypothetical protein